MRIGQLRSKANDYAVAASIHTGKPVHSDVFLPRPLRSPPTEKSAGYYLGLAKGLGLKVEAY
jgi:hypothetical protein